VLASVVRRDWGRHIPAALALLALTALVVALARPERTVATERREATVVLVSDTSVSMRAKDVPPDRLEAAKTAGRACARRLPEDFRLGVVTFSTQAEQVLAPTTDRALADAAISTLRAHGGTAMGDGLELGLAAAQTPAPDGRRQPGALILLSDGFSTDGDADPLEVAREARRQNVRIYTVALGRPDGILEQTQPDGTVTREPVPPDTDTLQEVARLTNGRYFAAADEAQLDGIYDQLSSRLTTRPERQEATALAAGVALLLLAGGSALGVSRAGRLP
jgi:Ca-activated chloride channel homolog